MAGARAALQTIESSDPRVLRLQVLETLQAFASAEEALYFRYHIERGTAHYASLLASTPQANAVYPSFEGKSAYPPARGHLSPRAREVSRFVGQETLRNLPHALDDPLQQLVYGPLGIEDELRALFFDGRRFIGRVALHHSAANRLSTKTIADLNRLVPEVLAVLVHADRLERAELDPPPQFIVGGDTRIDLATPSGAAWLTPPRRARIADIIRHAERGAPMQALAVIEGTRATIVRLYGTSVAYLVTLEAACAPELASDHLLTPRQREIAEYAVAGATNAEIGQTLSLSTDTVHDHMKGIYRRLGVVSRVELANHLRQR